MTRNSVSLKVPVQVELMMNDAQQQVEKLKQLLGTVKADSSMYKGLSSQVDKLDKAFEKLKDSANKPFTNQKDIDNFEKQITNLMQAFQKTAGSFGKVKFSDLILSKDDQQKVKEFEDQISGIKGKITQVKADILKSLRGSDEFKDVFSANKILDTKSFDQVQKILEGKLSNIRLEIERTQQEIETAKKKVSSATKDIKYYKSIKDLSPYIKILEDSTDTRFFNKTGVFKKGGKEAFSNELKQANLSQEDISQIMKMSKNQMIDFLKNSLTEAFQTAKTNFGAGMGEVKAGSKQLDALQAKANPLQNLLETMKSSSTSQFSDLEAKLLSVTQAYENYKQVVINSSPASQEAQKALEELIKAFRGAPQVIDSTSRAMTQLTQRQDILTGLQFSVQHWFGFYQILNMTRSAVRSMITNVRELDKVMTDIAVVTDMTQKDLWAQMDSYSSLAQQYGTTIKGVYEVSQLYYQQGLQTNEVMKLTEQTLVMAKVSGLDYAKATDYMTVAVRGFSMEMSEAQRVTDVYSALAAKTATDTTELATAMSKVASGAASVGSSFESTSAMLATMISVTREAPENLGSALKSIVSRFGELKSDPSTLVDSEGEALSLNNVDKALQSVGISLHDVNGQFRDFDDVIMELAKKWNTIDKNAQRYIATVAAGNRQQSRFLALVGNYDLLKESMDIAANSEDEGALQMLKTMDSLETKINQLQNSVKLFYTSSGIEELMKFVVDFGTTVVNYLNNMPKLFGKLPVVVLTTLVNLISVVKQMLYNGITELIARIKVGADEASEEIKRKAQDTGDESARSFAEAFKARFKGLKDSTLQPLNEGANSPVADNTKASKLDGVISFVKNSGLQIGAALQATSLLISNKNANLSQGISGVGNIISGGARFLTGGIAGKITGVISIFSGISQIVDALRKTVDLRQQIEEQKKIVEELNNEALVKRSEYRSLDVAIKKYNELKEKRYESVEAEEEYKNQLESLAEKYPELISSFNNLNEATIETSAKEEMLASLREKSAQATLEAARAELELKKKETQQANEEFESSKESFFDSFQNQLLSFLSDTQTFGDTNGDEAYNELIKKGYSVKNGERDLETGVFDTVILDAEGNQIFSYQNFLEKMQELSNENASYEEIFSAFSELTNNDEVLLDFLNSLFYGEGKFSDYKIENYGEYIKAWEKQQQSETAEDLTRESNASAILNERGSKLNLVKENSSLTNLISKQISELMRTEELSDTDAYAQVEDESLSTYENFWNALSEDKKKMFNEMFSSPEKYSSDSFSKEFSGIDGFDEVYKNLIVPYYKEIIENIQTNLSNFIESNFKDIDKNIYEPLSNLTINVKTQNQSNSLKQALSQVKLLTDKGLTDLALEYSTTFSSLFKQILNSNSPDEIFSLLQNADLTTVGGIQAFQKQIEESKLLDETEKQEILESLTSLTSSIVVNLNAEIKTLQDSLVKKVKSMSDDFDDLTKGLSIDEALEAYNKMVAAGIENLGSFTEVFKIDETDPSKYVLANSEKLQAYQDAEISVLQKEASALDEAFAAIQSLSSGANSNDSLTVITTQIRSLQGLKNSSNENLSEEDARILFSHNQDLLKTFDEAGVWDLIYKYLIDENYTEEQLQKAINERVEGLQMSQEALEEINANAEKYASIKPLLAMGNYEEALGKVDEDSPWQPYIEKEMEEAYQSFMDDFLSGGIELIQKNRATYGNDIQGIIDSFDNSNAVAKVKERYEAGIGWTIEEYNDALAQAVELETKATSGAAQEALKDITFVGDGAFGTLDAVQALADAINIPLDQLTDLMSPDQFGNYKLNLDNEEIRSKVEGITNYELLYAESVTNFFDEINGWLEDALGGNLDIADRVNLTDSLGKLGIQIDPNAFTQTVDGFKLAQSEAYRVLTTLQSINSLAGKVMLSSLVESAMDSDERLNDIFYVMRRIDELNKEINNAKPGTARREELEGELAVCKEITAELKKADDTFNFMNRDLPSGYDDPLSAWEGIGDAFKVLDGDDFKNNQIGYQDFYNMITMMGDDVLHAAGITSEKMNGAAKLLDAGAQALVNVDGETFVDLSKLGANFNLGATNMKEGLTKGIHTLAQNQIDMLDAEIAMLETVVQTQEAFDSIAGEDEKLSLGEFFPVKIRDDLEWDEARKTLAEAVSSFIGDIEINGQKLSDYLENPKAFSELDAEWQNFVINILNIFKDTDWTGLSGEDAKLMQDKFNQELEKFGKHITIDPSKLIETINITDEGEENPLIDKILSGAGKGWTKEKLIEAIKKTGKTEISVADIIDLVADGDEELQKKLQQLVVTEFSEGHYDVTLETWVTTDGKVRDGNGNEVTAVEMKEKALTALNSTLNNDDKLIVHPSVGVGGVEYTVDGVEGSWSSYEDALDAAIAAGKTKQPETTATETDIEIVPQKIYIKEGSGALGEDGSLLITDPIAKATATVAELEIDPTGAKAGMKQVQGAVSSPIEIEITDEITGKASTLTITPSTTPTLELGEETPTVSDVSATAESATVKPTSYQVDLTDSEGNTQSVTVDGTANLETVISGLTKDENGNYSIDSVNGIAQVSAEVSQADTSIQTLWDKWSNKEITFTVKSQEEGEESDNTKSSAELRKIVNEKKWSKESGDNTHVMLTTYRQDILSTVSAIQQLTDLGIPVSQEDIQFLRDLQDALIANGGSPAGANYPTVEALGELADKCVQLNNVSPTVLATANTLSTMNLAQTATYLADMVTNAENLIELEFTNFADLETATETAKTTVDSIATKLAEMTGRTITINVVEQQNGNDGEGGNSTYTTTYSFNTDNLTSAVTSIQNASNNATTAIEKVASAMDEIPTDSSKAKAVSDTGKSIKNLPDKKTVKVVISQSKTAVLNAVATLTVKVQGAGSVISGITQKNFTTSTNSKVDATSGKAKGNVALAKGTKTLMGELGPELVVSNGHYFVAGENGAEFVNLADDAIVFNHLQTKKLLQNGNAGRGMAVTNEKKATSMATGNAMASASDALAELKRIRAMWQALLDSSASDLGKKAGSGGGGGGGGGKGDDPKAITHDLERWYNLLRQIAKAEQQITLEQAKRKNMQSGYNYSDSLEKELGILKKQEQAYRQLASIQEDWYNIRRKELLNTDFSKIFTYDKDGLMQYVDGADRGLDILAKLNSTDATGAPTGVGKNSQTQLNYLKSIGFDVEKYLRTNDDGTKAETTDDMMQNFWDRVDGWMEELDGLYDEYNDHLKDIEENVASQNEILQEYIDNQLSVEEKLLNAIVDRQQAQIDKMQDLLDATQNASEEYIKGLTDALNKEQQLYNKNQNDRELSKLQRQLAILQRSGGSASEIKNLQNQIDSKLQSDYFDAMQKQIDTIQEASDNQLEKLQKQIDIATEALEYQKENGLLWQEVYQMMNEWTPEKMLEFIEKYTQSYREDSGLQSSENSKETKKELEIWANKRDMNARDEAWKKYYSDAKYDDTIKKNYSASAQEAFNAGYASGGVEEGARRANEIFENAKKNQNSSTSNNGSGSGSSAPTPEQEARGNAKFKNKDYQVYSYDDATTKKKGPIVYGNGKNVSFTVYDEQGNRILISGTDGKGRKIEKRWVPKKYFQYAQGGLVDYTGPAWVDGSKSKPEAFLSAKDTALLKSKIFSDSNFSLRSCIEAIQALADNFRSISTDNSENINIENISIQVGNGTISSDYSARKAGQEIMDEILNVAKKAGNLTLARR